MKKHLITKAAENSDDEKDDDEDNPLKAKKKVKFGANKISNLKKKTTYLQYKI